MLARLGRLLAAALVVLTATCGLAPEAHADPITGSLVVSVADQYGRPVPFALQVIDESDSPVVDPRTPAATTRELSVPTGAYGLAALTSFGGLVCRGYSPCDPSAFDPVLDPSTAVQVVAGTTAAGLSVTLPSIAGTGVIGAPLTISLPPELTAMEAGLVGAAASTATPYSGILQIVWLRDGAPTGQTGTTYVPSADDAGRAITARVSRDAVGAAMMQQILVDAPTSYETTPVTVSAPASASPTPTATAPTPAATPVVAPAALARPSITAILKRAARPSVLVRVRAAGTQATGSVSVIVAGWRRDGVLRGGSVRIPLGDFRPGTYRVRIEYAGSAAVATGVVTKKLTIRADRGKRHSKN